MGLSRFLASSTLLHFQGVLQEAVKLLGKGAGVGIAGGELQRRQQEANVLQLITAVSVFAGLGGPPSHKHAEVQTQGILPCSKYGSSLLGNS